MPPELASDFRASGLTHLLAVSGTNLTLVVGFMLIVARWAGVRARGLLVVGARLLVDFILSKEGQTIVEKDGHVGHGAILHGCIVKRNAMVGMNAAVILINVWHIVRILREPKNALLKQYEKMFDLEGIGLTVEMEALRAVARKAIERGTGARGLRAVLEDTLLEVMFDIPSRDDVREVVLTAESVEGRVPPLLVLTALAGIVQALLLTRHMLFVGFALRDDHFHAVVHDVRRALGDNTRPEKLGTALLLEPDQLQQEQRDERAEV